MGALNAILLLRRQELDKVSQNGSLVEGLELAQVELVQTSRLVAIIVQSAIYGS